MRYSRTKAIVLAAAMSLAAREAGAGGTGVPSNCRWASGVVSFSSQYTPGDWSAAQALGPPDSYPAYDDLPTAWASLTPHDQREFLVLSYDEPAPINFVNVYETLNPGAIDLIAVKNPGTGLFETVWAGAAVVAPEVSRVFTAIFPQTPYSVSEVRIELASPEIPGWNEVDAVEIGLCDFPTRSQWAADVVDFSSQWSPQTYSAAQALGPPNTYPAYGDLPTAWASLTADDQREFLILGYDTPNVINFVNVYETLSPGALDMVAVKNPGTGGFEVVWAGTAAPAPPVARIVTAHFPVTQFPVREVLFQFNSPAVPGWNEIDAAAIGRCGCNDLLVDVPQGGPPSAANVLAAPRPNPFRGSTEFSFSLRSHGHVRIEVFSALGQRVARLVDGVRPAGPHVVRWSGRDDRGREMGSGIYYVRAEGDDFRIARKVVKIE
jgi:hypothetical protein